MSHVALRAEGLGKRYEIRHLSRRRHDTLRDAVSAGARDLFRRSGADGAAASRETIWALRDVSFEVGQGEVIGLIGGNGAGKSTLLKILSRIVVPSEGRAELHGRVGSLLEVGTGFHSELTGRENIFLSGAILGMRRAEINRAFDQIVEFAGVEQFLDTPVKHYSSGMYLRLAFAVAAHLEPEVLLVDEVLAVGDAAFQKKCLGKMNDVARGGRTVVFVSHNMEAVRRLCPRTLLLERGRVVADGPTEQVTTRYLARAEGESQPGARLDLRAIDRHGSGDVRFVAARYASDLDAVGRHAYTGGPLEFVFEVESPEPRTVESFAVSLRTIGGGTRLVDVDIMSRAQVLELRAGINQVRVRLDAVHLSPGSYSVGLWAGRTNGETFDLAEAAFDIEVLPAPGVAPGGHGLVACDFSVAVLEPAAVGDRG